MRLAQTSFPTSGDVPYEMVLFHLTQRSTSHTPLNLRLNIVMPGTVMWMDFPTSGAATSMDFISIRYRGQPVSESLSANGRANHRPGILFKFSWDYAKHFFSVFMYV